MSEAPLRGFVVGVTADRKADEQVSMLQRCGAQCVVGPVMRRRSGRDDQTLIDRTQELVNNPADYVILNTGSGAQDWFDVADSSELLSELYASVAESQILVRGFKAHGVATRLGLDVAWRAPNGQMAEIVEYLHGRGIDGKKVAVQLDGIPTGDMQDNFLRLGAKLVELHPYEWSAPENRQASERLVRLVADSSVDAVTFTSRAAVINFMAVAESIDLHDQVVESFRAEVLAACIGPICAEGARSHGLENLLLAEHARLGSLVRTLAYQLEKRSTPLTLNGFEVEMRGHQLTVEGSEPKVATFRERQVLTVLAERPGVVYSKRKLLNVIWGRGQSDEHVVEVTVGRLRRRLGDAGAGIETVRRRGYRLRKEPV